MELAGRALRSRDTNVRHADGNNWTTPLIGVAPLARVTGCEMLKNAQPDEGCSPPLLPYIKQKKNDSKSAALDINHSHFVLVDNTETDDWGGEVEMRALIEKRLSEKLALPYVLLVVQGGRGTIAMVRHAFKNNCPVVLVRESGGCARAVAEFVEEMRRAIPRLTQENAARIMYGKFEVHCPEVSSAAKRERLLHAVSEIVRLLLPTQGEDLVHIFSLEDQRTESFETSILKAVVASCKLRSDIQKQARQQARSQHKQPRRLGSHEQRTEPPTHVKARTRPPSYPIERIALGDEHVKWDASLGNTSYSPPFYDSAHLAENRLDLGTGGKYADPPKEALTSAFKAKIQGRLTYENGGRIEFDPQSGLPRNPRGRTGLAGRGVLGQWGPNHAADPIVTRLHPQTNQLQMVAIERSDTEGIWAIPGGFVDEGEHVSATVMREFIEEAGVSRLLSTQRPCALAR